MSKNIDLFIQMQYCLRYVLLPAKGHGLDYQTVKNLSVVDRVVKEKMEERKTLDEKHFYKNESGKPTLFYLKKTGENTGQFVVDEKGEYVIYTNQLDGKGEPRINQTKEYLDAVDQLMKDEIDVKLHAFPIEKVKEAYESGAMEGLDVACLFGVLIIDED